MIFVGLGNPGKEYEDTRHNVGFVVLEKLAEKNQITWKSEFGVRWAKIGPHWLIEPMEFMNVSGQTLKSFLEKKKVEMNPATDLIVVHDEVDFPLGEVHQQRNRSGAGHNGVQSIIDALGTQDFERMRIGIGNNREKNIPAEDYVLQKFSAEERSAIAQAIDDAISFLEKK